jgi:hypothetical protein
LAPATGPDAAVTSESETEEQEEERIQAARTQEDEERRQLRERKKTKQQSRTQTFEIEHSGSLRGAGIRSARKSSQAVCFIYIYFSIMTDTLKFPKVVTVKTGNNINSTSSPADTKGLDRPDLSLASQLLRKLQNESDRKRRSDDSEPIVNESSNGSLTKRPKIVGLFILSPVHNNHSFNDDHFSSMQTRSFNNHLGRITRVRHHWDQMTGEGLVRVEGLHPRLVYAQH